jgi:isoleucyl-tRNA synthetase
MHNIFEALCKLLAPILAFTAEEAWRYLGTGDSVHLQVFPESIASKRNELAEKEVNELLELRAIVSRELEEARQHKVIGNSLEAKVVLELATDRLLHDWQGRESEMEEIFILSDLTLIAGAETKAAVTRTEYAKCARCWRHRPTVGASASHPDLCDRCEAVVTSMSKVGST